MAKVTPISRRKSEHIRINTEEDVRSGITNGLEHYFFVHEALPEINLDEIDLGVTIFNRKLCAPILISSMTGGTQEAAQINQNLAIAAQEMRVALGMGSQRAALDHTELAYTYQVRKWAPDILLLANLGAIQLNYNYGIDHCRKAVDMIEADGLILHLNPLQEAIQTKGDTHFFGLLKKIEQVCKSLPVPVIVKEVGWGISGNTARRLVDAGVKVIDVAGAGGTSWSQVEMHRAKNPSQAHLAAAFIEWGIPTAESIIQVREAAPQVMIFASGGLRSGLDITKCIALGAELGGIAGPFLKAAGVSANRIVQKIAEINKEILVTMFAVGANNIPKLHQTRLIKST